MSELCFSLLSAGQVIRWNNTNFTKTELKMSDLDSSDYDMWSAVGIGGYLYELLYTEEEPLQKESFVQRGIGETVVKTGGRADH